MALAKKLTQLDAAKMLVDATQYVCIGLGFDLEIKFKNEVPGLGNQGTIAEGLRDLMRAAGVVAQGSQIMPKQLLEKPKPGLILP